MCDVEARKAVFVGHIHDKYGHRNGKVYLGSHDDALLFIETVRTTVPRVEVTDESNNILMSFIDGVAHFGNISMPASPSEHMLGKFALPNLIFHHHDEIRPWLRNFKLDLVAMADRHRFQAINMMMDMQQPMKQLEISLLVWAANNNFNLLAHGYRESLAVIQEILMFNDEDF